MTKHFDILTFLRSLPDSSKCETLIKLLSGSTIVNYWSEVLNGLLSITKSYNLAKISIVLPIFNFVVNYEDPRIAIAMIQVFSDDPEMLMIFWKNIPKLASSLIRISVFVHQNAIDSLEESSDPVWAELKIQFPPVC